MKGGIGYNLRISGFELYLQDIYLLILSREIDIKLCQNYTKTGICQILYKSCSFKQIIFNNYATNLKTIIPQEPENLRFANIIIFYFIFFIFIDIIDIQECWSPMQTVMLKIVQPLVHHVNLTFEKVIEYVLLLGVNL